MHTRDGSQEPVAAASPGNDIENITLQQALPRLVELAALPGAQAWHIILVGRALAEGLDLAALPLRQFTEWTGKGRSTYFAFRKSAVWAFIQSNSPTVQTSGPCMVPSMSLKALKKHCTTKHDPAGRTPGPDDKPAVALAIERLETISWGLRNGYRVEESTDLVSRHGARNVLYACACAKNKRSPAGFVRWHLETAQKAAPDGWEDPQLRELAQEASTVPADGSDESDRPKQHAPTPVPTTDAADVPLRAALTTALPPGVSVVAVAREGDKVAVWLPQAAVYGTILGRKLKRVAGEVLGVPVVVECREATMDRLAVFRV